MIAIIEKMNEAEQRLRSVVHSGARQDAVRSWQAIDHYDSVRASMVKSNWWHEWCEHKGYAASHTGVDYFA